MTPLEALTRIQTAIARYLNPSDPMDDKEFIDEVLAAGDDREVVRAVREEPRSPSALEIEWMERCFPTVFADWKSGKRSFHEAYVECLRIGNH